MTPGLAILIVRSLRAPDSLQLIRDGGIVACPGGALRRQRSPWPDGRSPSDESNQANRITEQDPAVSEPQVGLREIFLVFGKIGLLSFGGGLSGWVFREVVQRRGWINEQQFASGLALSQILPGANVTNLSMYVGQRLRGTRGALSALSGLLIGPFFIVIGFFLAYDAISSHPWVPHTISGVAAAAVGLIIVTAWRTGRRSARSVHGVAIVLATSVAVGVFHWPLVLVVACVAPLSVAAAWKWNKPDAP
jgi:chromate transporter